MIPAQVDRRTMLSICRVSKARFSHRHAPWVDPKEIEAHMPPNATATLAWLTYDGFADGKTIVVTNWSIPLADGTTAGATITMFASRLRELEGAGSA